jgi:hypothetical protein
MIACAAICQLSVSIIGQLATSVQLATSGLGNCCELLILPSDPWILTRTHVKSQSAIPTPPAPVTDNVCSFTFHKSTVKLINPSDHNIDRRLPTKPNVCSFTLVKSAWSFNNPSDP